MRAHSTNTEVLRACSILAPPAANVRIFDGLAELPHFNPDLDIEGAIAPDAVARFRREIGEADAVIISSPEYAHGVPGSLKNALDWLVSAPELVFKPIGLLNVSPRSRHAYASLAETLRTMSTTLVPEASLELSLTGAVVSAEEIAANPETASRIQAAVFALCTAAGQYRQRVAGLP